MSWIGFLALLACGGLGGYALLGSLGLDDLDAWAGGRTAGLVAAALPAWWAGSFGFHGWPMVGAAVIVGSALWGATRLWKRRPWRDLIAAETVIWTATVLVLVMRLDKARILQQEKLMDQGIMASLLRAQSFPPPDMWLSGHSLPYYYWGALVWALPMRLANLPLEIGYNLVVGLVAGLAAVLAWAVATKLTGGNRRAGLLAAAMATVAGTPDGLRQLLAGRSPWALDLWASSRQVPDTITEFPLFTLWHGDLHPHLLSIPLALLAMLIALHAGRRGPGIAATAATAAVCGVTWAANPWAMPPTMAAAGLLLLTGDGQWMWPWRGGWRRWLAVASLPVGAWLATAPFQLDFSPPFQGIAAVFAWTPPVDILLWGGVVLLPVGCVVVKLTGEWIPLPPRAATQSPDSSRDADVGSRRLALQLVVLAVVTVIAATTRRPTLVFLAFGVLLLTAEALRPGKNAIRSAMALAALGVFLLAVPEVLYVVDSYGTTLHRMNTVFKAYIQAWVLLAVVAPALLAHVFTVYRDRVTVVLVIAVLALPHPVSAFLAAVTAPSSQIDGLAWMDAGDRSLVDLLRREPPGTTLVEAVGPAYSEFARLSSASGVPAYLGWENHEMVWRGSDVTQETTRRREQVQLIYTCGDPEKIARVASEAGIDVIAVGSLEQRKYNANQLAAVRAAGTVVPAEGGAFLVRIDTHGSTLQGTP